MPIGSKSKKAALPLSKEAEEAALKQWEETMRLTKEEVVRNRALEGRRRKKT